MLGIELNKLGTDIPLRCLLTMGASCSHQPAFPALIVMDCMIGTLKLLWPGVLLQQQEI